MKFHSNFETLFYLNLLPVITVPTHACAMRSALNLSSLMRGFGKRPSLGSTWLSHPWACMISEVRLWLSHTSVGRHWVSLSYRSRTLRFALWSEITLLWFGGVLYTPVLIECTVVFVDSGRAGVSKVVTSLVRGL